jgi:hypothetical protein
LLIPEDDSQQNDLVLQTRLRTVISRNIWKILLIYVVMINYLMTLQLMMMIDDDDNTSACWLANAVLNQNVTHPSPPLTIFSGLAINPSHIRTTKWRHLHRMLQFRGVTCIYRNYFHGIFHRSLYWLAFEPCASLQVWEPSLLLQRPRLHPIVGMVHRVRRAWHCGLSDNQWS